MELFKKKLDKEKLLEILDCFFEITGIGAAYYENADENISSKNISAKNMESCDFCKSIRKIPSIDEACMKCDDHAFLKARETRTTDLYRCHIGLWEAVVPLFKEGKPTGFLMIGQVKNCGSEDLWDPIESRLLSLGTKAERIEEIHVKFGQLPEFHSRQVEAATKMLEIIAQNIMATDIITIYDSTSVEKTKNFLHQHFAEPIPLKSLASILATSPSSLSSLFKKQTGTSITAYVENLRMGKSRELLLMTSLSVKEIACRCGYEDQNYFSRVFKKNTKTSPKQYREIHKE